MTQEGICGYTAPTEQLGWFSERASLYDYRKDSLYIFKPTPRQNTCRGFYLLLPSVGRLIHNGALKEFHSGKVSLEQAFELQVWRFPVINAQLTLGRDSPPPVVGRPYHAFYVPKYAVVGWNGGASARAQRRNRPAVISHDCIKRITR